MNRTYYILYYIIGLCTLFSCQKSVKPLEEKNILLVYSNISSDFKCSDYEALLRHEFENAGYNPAIQAINLSVSGINNISDNLDSVGDVDVIISVGDFATNACLEYKGKLSEKTLLFTDVHFPDKKKLQKRNNVFGLRIRPYFKENVDLVQTILGNSKIIVVYNSRPFSLENIKNLREQLSHTEYDIESIEVNDSVTLRIEEFNEQKRILEQNSHAKSFVRLIPFDNVDGITVIKNMQESDKSNAVVFLQNSPDASIFNIISHVPVFNVFNNGFGTSSRTIGGYFVPREDGVRELVRMSELVFNGGRPEKVLNEIKPTINIDYSVAEEVGLDISKFPSETRFINRNYPSRYENVLITIYVVVAVFIVFLIVVIIRWRIITRKIKKQNQMIADEHRFLTNTVMGSDVICGVVKDGYINILTSSNQNIGKLRSRMSLEEFQEFIHPEDRMRFMTNIKSIHEKKNFISKYRCDINMKGNYSWYEVVYDVIQQSDDSFVAAGLFHNIQNIVEEEEVLVRNREIIEKTDMKQAFLENMTHEIRSPLNSIVGFSNLLSSPDASMLSDEDKKTFKALMQENVDNLLLLLDEILELSRQQSNKMPFNPKSYTLDKVTRDVYLSFKVIVNPNLELIFEEPDCEAYVEVDKLRFTQVIMNFLTNSNKFTTSGYIKIGSRCDKEKKEAYIYVEDTGQGMEKDKIDTIFERFAKASEDDKGTGIGLSLCSVIAKRMNGRIEVESQKGVGSKFTLIVPCR